VFGEVDQAGCGAPGSIAGDGLMSAVDEGQVQLKEELGLIHEPLNWIGGCHGWRATAQGGDDAERVGGLADAGFGLGFGPERPVEPRGGGRKAAGGEMPVRLQKCWARRGVVKWAAPNKSLSIIVRVALSSRCLLLKYRCA
jgi:hypothetical protein